MTKPDKTPREARPKNYGRNLAIFATVAVLIGAAFILAYVLNLVVQGADQALHPPQIPLAGSPADAGITAYEDVAFTAEDGVTLRGWYVAPRNGAVIVFAHGHAWNRMALLPEAGVLAERGYGALLFDFGGHGESDPVQVSLGDREQRDLRAAVDFVIGQPGVEHVGALGFSMGGSTLAQLAQSDERIEAVVVEAAFPSLAAEIRYQARVFGPLSQLPALWEIERAGVDVRGVSPVDGLCRISPRPLLLVYGTLDSAVPSDSARAMAAAACEPFELWLVEGMGHQNPMQVVPEAYTARLVDFFGAALLEE